jgi:methionyl-tRNA formyltransferase
LGLEIRTVLLFGDSLGIPQLVEVVPRDFVCGLIGAEIRPQYHSELESIASGAGVPFIIQPRKSSPAYQSFVERVRSLAPDLILVNSYSMLLRDDVLSIPGCGAINVHTALLPRYRGSNPFQWVIINNETETGVTMHYMTADFDAGDIVAQRRVAVCFEDTWRDLQSRCAAATREMLSEEMPRILSQKNTRRPQDDSNSSRFNRRRPEDGRIDWRQSVLSIYNLIRALVKPLPGAYYYSAGKVLLDEYLFVPEVTALKYTDTVGGQRLRSGDISLINFTADSLPGLIDSLNGGALPIELIDAHARNNDERLEFLRRRNDLVIFGVHLELSGLVGFCWLRDIDYRESRAQLGVRIISGEASEAKYYQREAAGLLASFASKDLNLRELGSPDG